MATFTKKQLVNKIVLKYIDDDIRPAHRQQLNNFNKETLVKIFEKQEENKAKERKERFTQIKPVLFKQDLVELDPDSAKFIKKLQIKCELFNTLCSLQMFVMQLYKRYYNGKFYFGTVNIISGELQRHGVLNLSLKEYQSHAHIGVKYAYEMLSDKRFPVYYTQLRGLFHPNWKFVPYIFPNDNEQLLRFFSALHKLKTKLDA
jgi:hypothetical protein